jgi:SAM-dependent methyltransferase
MPANHSLLVNVVESCANCGSASYQTWGATIGRDQLHFSQCRCDDCGLIFSNPQCDQTTLNSYYADHYYEDHWPQLLDDDENAVAEVTARLCAEVERIKSVIKAGKLLEVGSGTGAFLRLMQDEGFETHGVELSRVGIEYASRVHSLSNIRQGTLEDAAYPAESFDIIYAWHVIEHVIDLDAFVRELHRLLRPRGLLWLGTENYSNSSYFLTRLQKLLHGLPPPFATSSEHTFAFTARTLADVLRRRGFDLVFCETYQPLWRDKLGTMKFRSVLSKGYFMGQHVANHLFRTGPLLRLAARRSSQ